MRWSGPRLRRIGGVRLDHALLVTGAVVMSLGSVMPWIKGSTRLNGNIEWTGLDDTGEGAMFLAAALALAAWVRWRGTLEEIAPRTRFIPIAVGVGCLLLWIISFQKVLYLSWFEIDVGARPQPALFVALLGIALIIAGGLLAATDPESLAAARAAAEREKRRSGAGGDGAASDRTRQGGGERPPSPDGYSVVGRVDRLSGRRADGPDDDRGRGRG